MAHDFEQPVPVPNDTTNPVAPIAEQDPAERWLELDPSRQQEVHSDPLGDTNTRIPRIPLEGLVEGVPESYPTQAPTNPIENTHVATPQTSSVAPSGYEQTAPVKSNRKRNTIIGSALAGTLLLAGAVVGIAKANGDDHDAAPTAQDPVATATGNPGSTTLPGLGETPSNSPTEQPTEAPSDNTGEQPGVAVGNLSLSDPLYSSTSDSDGQKLIVGWDNQDIYLSMMPNPQGTDPTVLAASALNLIAASISADLQYSPQLIEGLTGYPRQSDHPVVKELMSMNTAFHNSEAPEDQATSVEQLAIFDEADDPAVFKISPNTDKNGFPMLVLSSGTVYVQRVKGGDWQDPSNFDVSQAAQINHISISFKDVDNHPSIESYYIPGLVTN